MSLRPFFKYAKAREEIRILRATGAPGPWTKDPVLQRYRFCNVFREDDKTTRWFKENIRGPLSSDPHVAFATILFRWFNRIETGETLLKHDLIRKWSSERCIEALTGVEPIVTGAYLVKTPSGMDKLHGLCQMIDTVHPIREELAKDLEGMSLQEAHERIMQIKFQGSFTAYEIVTDLRHTYLLGNAPDIMTWASAGPGAARGLGRLLHNNVDHYSYNAKRDQRKMLDDMKRILDVAHNPKFWQRGYWPREWPEWEMREVEHTLCEFDKHCRATFKEGRPKQLFRGGKS